jgi:DnaK suppressor protein
MGRMEIQRFKRILEFNRDKALRFRDRAENEARSFNDDGPQDTADLSLKSLSKEALFEQSSQKRLLVRMIDSALQRIAEGTFGICVACGEDISRKRLAALPWTEYCLRCQEGLEQTGGVELYAKPFSGVHARF